MDIPVNISGSVTIILLVVLGLFVYPWLLGRRGGGLVVAVVTVVTGVLYYLFDNPSGLEPGASGALAIIWAVLPAAVALLVRYYQRKGAPRP